MALPNLYRIPYYDVCEGKQDSLIDFDINERVQFYCDSEYKYTYQCQLQPMFAPVSFDVYGYKISGTVQFAIPYYENEENYLDLVIDDINDVIDDHYNYLLLNKDNIQTSSKTLNPNQQTGISPIVSQSVLFRQEFQNNCEPIENEIPIYILLKSELYQKILKIKTINLHL